MTLQTELGQLLDLTSQPMDGNIDLNRFTLDRYRLIVKYKTAFYTFYLPIVRGLSSRPQAESEREPASSPPPANRRLIVIIIPFHSTVLMLTGVRPDPVGHGGPRVVGHRQAHLPHHGRVLPDPGPSVRQSVSPTLSLPTRIAHTTDDSPSSSSFPVSSRMDGQHEWPTVPSPPLPSSRRRQDDYLDCYGDPKVIGKVGTDIQDNKCSWLVVQALDRASPQQRKALEAHYGKHEPASVRLSVCHLPLPVARWRGWSVHHDVSCMTTTLDMPPRLAPPAKPNQVAAVKALYKEMRLEGVFKAYEDASYAEISKELDALPTALPRPVFEILLKKIYKRSK